jgi:phospholipase A1
MKYSKIKILIIISFCVVTTAYGQTKEIEEMWEHQESSTKGDFNKAMYLELDEAKISELLDNMPNFAMYKDNYFITGVPTNRTIDKYSTDAKFQISIRQRLTKTVLPFNTFLMLTYTQKSFWDIYAKSSPFADNNYNPGLAILKPIIYNKQLRGMVSFAQEHESNGKDSINSRAWDYFVLSGSYFFNRYFSIQSKIWAGWLGEENKDLYKYRGYGLIAFNYRSNNDRLWVSAVINPREKFCNLNTQLEVSIKLSKKVNQYLFLQWYNGYGESLLEYNQYTSMIRVGLCIKPVLRNLF